MNHDNISLPGFVIADLYKNCLIEVSDNQKAPAINNTQNPTLLETTESNKANSDDRISFLGDNRQHITIIIKENQQEYLSVQDQSFLLNVIKACNLTLQDVAIINVAKQAITYEEVRNKLQNTTILLFGVDTTEIKFPFTIPHFQVQGFDGFKVMVSPAVKALNGSESEKIALKKNLWTGLKKLFGI